MKTGVTIGQLACELNLNPKTIRYYEEVGILPEPQRSESGYRLYSGVEIERLRLVKRAKLLGLSLAEIKEIVRYAVDGRCGLLEDRLLSLVEAKLSEIDQRIKELIAFRGDLQRYHSKLSGRSKSTVPENREAMPSTACQCIGGETSDFREGIYH
ncbi:MAG: MerR family transcriptional regulator [Chloroflexi bacterium]|nr:MerR family transcriptional regulator [Chloroflexota bacterium]